MGSPNRFVATAREVFPENQNLALGDLGVLRQSQEPQLLGFLFNSSVSRLTSVKANLSPEVMCLPSNSSNVFSWMVM